MAVSVSARHGKPYVSVLGTENENLRNRISLLTSSLVTRCVTLRKLFAFVKSRRLDKVNGATVGPLALGKWRIHFNSLPSLSKLPQISLL